MTIYDRRQQDIRLDGLEQQIQLHEVREESTLVELSRQIERMSQDLSEVSEIVKAWNNAKGFVQTIQGIAKVVAVITLCVSPFVAFGYFIKTGHWK